MLTDNAAPTAIAYTSGQLGSMYTMLAPWAADGMSTSPGPGPGEEVRTVFVTGFPQNVQDRELFNLLRFLPGLEATQMNTKQSGNATSPQGFALFSSPAHAATAVLTLRDLEFETGFTLRCEMAHKNMYLKDDPSIRRADGRRLGMSPAQANGAVLTAVSPYGTAATAGGIAYAPAAAYGSSGMAFPGPVLASTLAALRPAAAVHHHHAAANGSGGGEGLLPPPGQAGALAAQQAGLVNTAPVAGFGPVTNRFDNPPCNTLFIGNLGDEVDEQELIAVFSRQPGYVQLKLLRQARNVACFVEFVNKEAAAAVHNSLQGALLESSTRGPIRIQFSKNPYGKRSPGAHSASAAAASLFGTATAAAAANGALNPSMASALMAASATGEFGAWPQGFVIAPSGLQ